VSEKAYVIEVVTESAHAATALLRRAVELDGTVTAECRMVQTADPDGYLERAQRLARELLDDDTDDAALEAPAPPSAGDLNWLADIFSGVKKGDPDIPGVLGTLLGAQWTGAAVRKAFQLDDDGA
jgi:hypothetical protein